MTKKTPLFDQHVAAGARIVDFGGWDMPLHYGSQKEEHHAVRQHAGVFDVSHMTIVDLAGERAREFLRYLLANDVAKLSVSGKALYTCMLNEQGGVIDDLIVYYIDDTHYRLVVNAATREKDLAWLASRPSGAHRLDLSVPRVQLLEGATPHELAVVPSGPEGDLRRPQLIEIERIDALRRRDPAHVLEVLAEQRRDSRAGEVVLPNRQIHIANRSRRVGSAPVAAGPALDNFVPTLEGRQRAAGTRDQGHGETSIVRPAPAGLCFPWPSA